MANPPGIRKALETASTHQLSTTSETPDILLNKFLCSGDVVYTSSGQSSPQQMLKEILHDKRWNRRMLEDWLKKGPQSNVFSVTPEPEFRAIYLILLSILEDRGKAIVPHEENSDRAMTDGAKLGENAITEDERKQEQKKFDERVLEHFNPDSTWEQV